VSSKNGYWYIATPRHINTKQPINLVIPKAWLLTTYSALGNLCIQDIRYPSITSLNKHTAQYASTQSV